MMNELTRKDVLQFVLRITIASAVTYFSLKWMMVIIDPTNKGKKKAKDKAQQQLKRLGIDKPNHLSEYELVIASRLVVPEDIQVHSWYCLLIIYFILTMRCYLLITRNKKNYI